MDGAPAPRSLNRVDRCLRQASILPEGSGVDIGVKVILIQWIVAALTVVFVNVVICVDGEEFVYRSYMQRGWRFVDENEKTLKIQTQKQPGDKTAQALARLAR